MVFSENKNDNKYYSAVQSSFCVKDHILYTECAAIPLHNISKVWVNDISRKVRLNNMFWVLAVLGVLGLLSSFSGGSGSGFTVVDNSWMFVPSLILLVGAAGFLAYYIEKNVTIQSS